MREKVLSVNEAAGWVQDGTLLGFTSQSVKSSPMAFLRELVRRKIRNLRMATLTGGGLFIGDCQSPQMRLPGAYGSAMLYYMAHRVVLFRTEHTKRTFVEKVDFVTAPGITPAKVHREGGPTKVVTPKALLAWDRQDGRWLLESVHPGSSVEEVKENTGFELGMLSSLTITPPPTEKELSTLRTIVREKLKRVYPDFAEKKIKGQN